MKVPRLFSRRKERDRGAALPGDSTALARAALPERRALELELPQVLPAALLVTRAPRPRRRAPGPGPEPAAIGPIPQPRGPAPSASEPLDAGGAAARRQAEPGGGERAHGPRPAPGAARAGTTNAGPGGGAAMGGPAPPTG